MPEIVDYKQYDGFQNSSIPDRDDFVGWMLLESMSLADRVQEILAAGPPDRLEVCLTINGIELPFVGTLQLLHDQLDKQIRATAAAKFDCKWIEATEGTFEALRGLRRTVLEKVLEMDPDYEGDC